MDKDYKRESLSKFNCIVFSFWLQEKIRVYFFENLFDGSIRLFQSNILLSFCHTPKPNNFNILKMLMRSSLMPYLCLEHLHEVVQQRGVARHGRLGVGQLVQRRQAEARRVAAGAPAHTHHKFRHSGDGGR